jgi:hypothetical protein
MNRVTLFAVPSLAPRLHLSSPHAEKYLRFDPAAGRRPFGRGSMAGQPENRAVTRFALTASINQPITIHTDGKRMIFELQ